MEVGQTLWLFVAAMGILVQTVLAAMVSKGLTLCPLLLEQGRENTFIFLGFGFSEK